MRPQPAERYDSDLWRGECLSEGSTAWHKERRRPWEGIVGVSRRAFIRGSAAAGPGVFILGRIALGSEALAERLIAQLSDPATQPKFVSQVPNALDPGFRYVPSANGEYTVGVGPTMQYMGLVNPGSDPVATRLPHFA